MHSFKQYYEIAHTVASYEFLGVFASLFLVSYFSMYVFTLYQQVTQGKQFFKKNTTLNDIDKKLII